MQLILEEPPIYELQVRLTKGEIAKLLCKENLEGILNINQKLLPCSLEQEDKLIKKEGKYTQTNLQISLQVGNYNELDLNCLTPTLTITSEFIKRRTGSYSTPKEPTAQNPLYIIIEE